MLPERPAFRPDLEGLRGVAILLVVLFHAGVPVVAGGFVGVDVFFVLSGFFITGLLAWEWSERGRLDLTDFVGKRALRLLPALLLVLLATLAAVMWLYAPIDRAPIAETARSVALYSGNLEFARNSLDYFGATENPLLHTWSLAVEEQFYIVWPLLFLLVATLYGGRTAEDAEDSNRRRLLLAIGAAGVASLVASLWLTRVAQPWAFFSMPTRIWEFALGGAVALVAIDRPEAGDRRGIVLQVAGLVAIAIGVFTYDRATPYPGMAAVLPAVGAIALIVGGQRAPDSRMTRALSADSLRWFGRMSYAWYLWHWPLVGLGEVIQPDIGVVGKLGWSAAALVLAWATYHLVEQPAREGGALARIPAQWRAPAALGASMAAAVIAHGSLVAARQQTSALPQKLFAAARSDRMQHDCWATTIEDERGPCEFGDRRGAKTLVLFGDSHAEHWLGALDGAGREHGWKIIAMVKGGCPVADMPRMWHRRFNRYYHECTRYREAMVRRIIALRPTAAILSSWDHYLPVDGKGSDWQVTPEMWRRGLRRTYARLTAAGINTVAIRGTPRTWFDVPACLSRRAARLPFARACEYDRRSAMSPLALAAQTDAARGLPVSFVDMNDVICATPRCPVMRNGVVIFTDDNHLTATFSRSVASILAARLAAALK